jgi:hypothetical protein
MTESRPPLPAAQTNGFAVASMVLGIVWVFWIGSLLAIVFGHVARSQIRRSGIRSGNGMALAGLVLGYLAFGILALTVATGGVVHVEVRV